MVQQGLLAEVELLRKHYTLHLGLPSMRCVGYRQAWLHLENHLDHAAFVEQGIIATRQLAKRQLTWLRSLQEHHFKTIDPLASTWQEEALGWAAQAIENLR
jgi:tRNA dimethylallyltransferase